jgi:hypothetical protein
LEIDEFVTGLAEKYNQTAGYELIFQGTKKLFINGVGNIVSLDRI